MKQAGSATLLFERRPYVLSAASVAGKAEEKGPYGHVFDEIMEDDRLGEKTFEQGQELVLFVTEVTAGYDTSWFVENFGCDAYFRHNKELLFDDTRRRIRDEIAAARAAEREV